MFCFSTSFEILFHTNYFYLAFYFVGQDHQEEEKEDLNLDHVHRSKVKRNLVEGLDLGNNKYTIILLTYVDPVAVKYIHVCFLYILYSKIKN